MKQPAMTCSEQEACLACLQSEEVEVLQLSQHADRAEVAGLHSIDFQLLQSWKTSQGPEILQAKWASDLWVLTQPCKVAAVVQGWGMLDGGCHKTALLCRPACCCYYFSPGLLP